MENMINFYCKEEYYVILKFRVKYKFWTLLSIFFYLETLLEINLFLKHIAMNIILIISLIIFDIGLVYLFFANRKKQFNPIIKIVFILIGLFFFFYTSMTIYALYYIIFEKGPL